MNDLRSIPLDCLVRHRDARALNETALADLAQSIDKLGLLNPPTVRDRGDGFYEIIAGSHRFTACDSLDWREIQCRVVDLDDDHAKLAMIDENLCRAELVGIERDRQIAERKAIYEALHPETRVHVAGAHASNATQGNAAAKLAPAFTAETAALTGRSERSIQRSVERGAKVALEAAELMRGTRLDTGRYADGIKDKPAAEQVDQVRRDLAGPPPKPPETRPAPAAGEAYTRFLSISDELASLDPHAVVAGIPIAKARADLRNRVSSLLGQFEAMYEMLEGSAQ